MNRVYLYGARENVRYTLVRGHIRDWLESEGIPALWSPSNKGWHVRTERIGDLLARAQHANFDVRIMGELPR